MCNHQHIRILCRLFTSICLRVCGAGFSDLSTDVRDILHSWIGEQSEKPTRMLAFSVIVPS